MNDTVFPRLAEIIGDVMELDSSEVTPELTAADVSTWDSLNHLRLITAVEEEFGVRFSMEEITQFENVGELAASVNQLRSAS